MILSGRVGIDKKRGGAAAATPSTLKDIISACRKWIISGILYIEYPAISGFLAIRHSNG